MSDIPTLALPTGAVDVTKWYKTPGSGGIYAPDNPPATLEVLNGGLDEENVDSAPGWLPMACVRAGTNVRGFWLPRTQYAFVYAKTFQLDDTIAGGQEKHRQRVPGLGARFYLPWDARCFMFTWSSWFRHDATLFDLNEDDGGHDEEYWDIRVFIDGDEYGAHYTRLPDGRRTDATYEMVDGGGAFLNADYVDPSSAYAAGMHDENRWRFVNKVGLITSGNHVRKGNHLITLSLWPRVHGRYMLQSSDVIGDAMSAKVEMPDGSFGVLAFRG